MTVTYSLNVANTNLCGFIKLLFRWKGSIYKLLYREVSIFCFLYYSLSFLYRFGLNEYQKLLFEKICTYCQSFTKFIPLSFVLGFYVTIVVTRWWDQFRSIPWPDKCMMLISSHLQGTDERSRMMRRTIARYLVLLLTFTFQAVSSSVKKRFPTLDHLQEAGLMTIAERVAYDKVPETHGKWWLPAQWCACILVRAKKEKRIKNELYLKQILDELFEYRSNCGTIFAYDWISIPLVYTQTVTIATYTYFMAAIMGRQYLDPSNNTNHEIDLYVPIFTILEFFFYMGWLKVAEQLINPFGEDDDDFELNWILDRNLFVGLHIADELHNQFPVLVKDTYWNDEEPTLPYTKSSVNLRSRAHLGSAINVFVEGEQAEFVTLDPIMEIEKDDYVLNDNNTSINQDADEFRYNYSLKVPDSDGLSVSTSGQRLQEMTYRNRLLNLLLGQSNENSLKNAKNMFYNTKKASGSLNEQILPPLVRNQNNSLFQMPFKFPKFIQQKKLNVTRSNTNSTNESAIFSIMKQKKDKNKNSDSSTELSRIFNDESNSLHSEPVTMNNFKSSPITFRKYSMKDELLADDQQSLINFEKLPYSSTKTSISNNFDYNQNPFLPYILNKLNSNSKYSAQKPNSSSLQRQFFASQLNSKIEQLAKNKQDDEISTQSSMSGLQMNLPNPLELTNFNSKSRKSSLEDETRIVIEDEKKSSLTNLFNENEASTSCQNYQNIKSSESNSESILIEDSKDLNIIKDQKPNITKDQKFNSINDQKLNSTKDQKEILIKKESIDQDNDKNLKNKNETQNSNENYLKKSTNNLVYEPNSSQESLSPFQSNQSTVTSFADFLNKKEKSK